ncbi:MAG TPA: ABC transporter [Acidimicrobiaceae bacterium]|nr:ABC transporter [Acidimicrobiaceae bacterium]
MSDLPPPPPPPPPTGPPSQPPPPTGEPVRQIARLVDGGEVMVEAIGVTKSFGDVVAVSDVTFQIGSGITAILGPNGAGKSTLFRMLCGLTPPSRGTVNVLGENPRTDREVRGRIGLAPQQDALFDRLSVLDVVTFAALTHGLTPTEADTRSRRTIAWVDLDPDDPKPVGSFSKGMRQRAKLAAAVVNDPAVLVLDEPLTGLDPVQRQRMIALFNELAAQGTCLLVSSHVLDEVARLGSNVLVIAQGRLAAAGDYHTLRDQMDDRPHRVRIGTDQPKEIAAALIERSLAEGVAVTATAVEANTTDVDSFGRAIAPLAVELGARLHEVAPLDDDLESVFRYLLERRR